MNRAPALAAVVALAALLVLPGCGERRDEGKHHPSELSDRIFDSVLVFARRGEIGSQKEFNAKRNEIAAGYLDSLLTDGLDRYGRLDYGKILFWGGRRDKARSVFEKLRKGDDGTARNAFRELITIEIEEENFAGAEEMMEEFRGRFPPVPDFEANLYSPCQDLAGRYSEAGKPDAATRIMIEELESLPFDAPYTSFYLASELIPLMMEMDRIDECRDLFKKYRSGLKKALVQHEAAAAAKDTLSLSDGEITKGYEQHIQMLTSLEQRLGLIGAEAPGFTFEHVYNGDASLSLEDLRGKIVLLDFWATWCMPCVIAFSELREIYAEYGDRGVAILGITSFQGMYRDLETGEMEGSPAEKLSREREIELTASFIEKHEMTWPCAISDRSVFDPKYGIQGIPTFVILDREGKIRLIQTGIGQKQQKFRMIDKLL